MEPAPDVGDLLPKELMFLWFPADVLNLITAIYELIVSFCKWSVYTEYSARYIREQETCQKITSPVMWQRRIMQAKLRTLILITFLSPSF